MGGGENDAWEFGGGVGSGENVACEFGGVICGRGYGNEAGGDAIGGDNGSMGGVP